MKKLLYLFSSMLMLLLYTCTKDEGIVPDPSGTADLKSAQSHGAVITLSPNGSDDTQALIDAFEDAKVAGPGSTVMLSEGTFTIGFIEIHDFDGNFKGSGRSRTKIVNKEELPCDIAWLANKLPALMKFIGGNITVSDLTFQIKDGRPCAFSEINDLYMGDLFSVLIIADYTDDYIPVNRSIKTVVKDADFIGGKDDGYGFWATEHNTGLGIWYGPDFAWPLSNEPFGNGEYTVKGCYFNYFLDGVEGFGLGHNAVMRVLNNTFTGSLMQLYYTANSGSKHYIQNNYFENGMMSDLQIEDIFSEIVFPNIQPDYRTEYHVSGNVFNSTEGITSLYLHDVLRIQFTNDDFAMLFDVKDNIFNTKAGGIAISSSNNLDAKIWNNKFRGTGSIGVMIDGDEASGIYCKNNKVIGNNFFDGFTDASVYLGPFSMNCKVVGVPSDQVIDLGQNNTIIGTSAHKGGVHAIHSMQHNLGSVHK
jgi:hypothetical protein